MVKAANPSKPLSGRTALITGGAKRLGRAIALNLADAGANIAITFRHSEREAVATVHALRKRGVAAFAVQCDVTDETSIRNAIPAAIRALGRLDILVNNAGNYETVEFADITAAQWDAIFASNTRGPFLVTQAAMAELKRRKGHVINLGSLGGLLPWADHAHYCSSKAALHMLTKVMAKALAPEVAVNCVAPGMIDVDGSGDAEFFTRMAKKTPMQRNGTKEEIAAAARFFAASPHFITGQIMTVDGGLGLG